MTFDKQAYMREYQRNRRAGKATSKAHALREILSLIGEPKGEIGKQIHRIASEALSTQKPRSE